MKHSVIKVPFSAAHAMGGAMRLVRLVRIRRTAAAAADRCSRPLPEALLAPHMPSPSALRRGLAVLVAGRVLSGALGIVWLGMLVRGLGSQQLGIYFGFVSAFELMQLASSLGVYSYAQRFVPGTWLQAGQREVAAMVLRVMAWRLLSLALAGAALWLAWPMLVTALGWGTDAPQLAACLAYLLAEGMLRIADALLDGALQHGARQLLPLARNIARMAWLAWATQHGMAMDAAAVVALEATLAAVLFAAAAAVLFARLRGLPARPPAAGGQGGHGSHGSHGSHGGLGSHGSQPRMAFALQGYGAMVLSLVTGMDVVKLIVSHAAGPAALAVFGVAAALVEMLERHMPAFLFHDVLRTVLTARAGSGRGDGDTLFSVRLLMRINGGCLFALAAWLAVFGFTAFHALPGASDFAAVAACVAALLPLLLVRAFRVMTGLVAHLNTDNRSVLAALLATVPVPLVVWAAAPLLGGGAAVLGGWLLELTYALVLKQRVGLRLSQLCGTWRCWKLLMLAALLSAAAGAASQAAVAGAAGVLAGSLVFASFYFALLRRWRVLDTQEMLALRRLFLAQPR